MISSQYLDALTTACTIEELWAMHTRRMADYGFDRLLYGFTRHRSGRSLGDPDDFVILTNHPDSYTEGYINSGLFKNAPMTKWALDNEGARSWRVIADRIANDTLSDTEKEVIAFNLTHKVHAGYSISFRSVSPRSKGAIALTARADLIQDDVDAIWAEHGTDITVLNNIVHLKIMTLPHFSPSRVLTKRQREVLEWVGDGKTTQDIATLLGLTSATVEKHLRLARDALNVETTAQAVMKAAFQNQMFVVEP
ncbi:LuxR family transcriptional regulator [Lutimaribacter sp. EGI FJ00015]|uniref:LuxR family transcriptional regulator n=1 Tax=Lutimaribacter degradans TaxID=2945989 RepID=A0ACC5ZSY1_9RHOB|nr:LuxR family transcriptional regulator [Lutimaribacter sp. EGI FJ00013]MCM2561192.1 LuxR family transcriptional regulator [Lutimaribacter sp. EGI FJ00013]MCO0611859.1 LuxR family transcriptional regulator [Lutimaribacter sp. EGI FJ00015]MCO0635020.1 LuxR family transcriptional regulator [Lutimaribacter sp. EGI FJ00014]